MEKTLMLSTSLNINREGNKIILGAIHWRQGSRANTFCKLSQAFSRHCFLHTFLALLKFSTLKKNNFNFYSRFRSSGVHVQVYYLGILCNVKVRGMTDPVTQELRIVPNNFSTLASLSPSPLKSALVSVPSLYPCALNV